MTTQFEAISSDPRASAPYDEYLLEAYRQAGENARMYATSRFSNLTSFLTYVGLLSAAVGFLYSNQDKHPEFHWGVLLVAVFGLVLALLFWALEVRHHHYWKFYETKIVQSLEGRMGRGQYMDHPLDGANRRSVSDHWHLGATKATYGIYLASCGFFVALAVLSFL